jgi:hypothetical protein
MANGKYSNCYVRIFDHYHDLPEKIQEFGLHVLSNINSKDKGLIAPSMPLNQLGDKMYPFDKDTDFDYCVLICNPYLERTQKLAFDVINQLSKSGDICRYDMPGGTLFYISFE